MLSLLLSLWKSHMVKVGLKCVHEGPGLQSEMDIGGQSQGAVFLDLLLIGMS